MASFKKWKPPLFYQYLISYVIILCMPIMVAGYIIYSHFVGIMEKQVMKDNQSMLLQIKNSVDMQVRQLLAISVQISSKPELTPYSITNFYDVFKAKSLLIYSESNEFISELLLYIRGSEYIFSAKSSYSLPMLFKTKYVYQNWPYSNIVKELDSLNNIIVRPAEDIVLEEQKKGRFMTLLAPIPTNSIKPYGTAIFLINEMTMINMLSSITNYRGGEGNAVILDSKGNVLTKLKDQDLLNEPVFQDAVQTTSGNSGGKVIKFNNLDYYVSYVRSPETSWTYITIIPEEMLLKPINDIRTKALSSIIVILFVGSVLIYSSMFLHYRPIGKLIRLVEQKWGGRSPNIYGIEKVHTAIEQADSRAKELQNQVELSQPVVKEHMLLQLLQGRYVNQDEFNSIGAVYGVSLTKRSFFTAILQFDKADTEQLQSAMAAVSAWGDSIVSQAELYVIKMEADKRLTVILSAEPDVQPSESDWSELQERVTTATGMFVTVGIGEMYDNMGEIGKSYIEASSAIAYKLIKGNYTIIFFRETFNGSKTYHWYPKREMAQLDIYMRQRNGQKFMNTAETLIREIERNSTTLFMAKFVCFDMINTVMKGIDEINGLQTLSLDIFPDVLKLTQYNDMRELLDVVADVSKYAYELLESDSRGGEELLLVRVMAYLQQHFVSYQFSVQHMSDDLKVSTSYLGRYVKEYTGKTILEHVNELRIEKAKQLLVETELQLVDLVPLVGYADVSSFIRKFKMAVSATPGEYRKMYGKAQ